jgi:hypothetical protein
MLTKAVQIVLEGVQTLNITVTPTAAQKLQQDSLT